MRFIGRRKELDTLAKLLTRDNAIAVIYGRRRVGKSSLIREFLKKREALYFEGVEGLPKRQQLNNFILQLNHQTGNSFKNVQSWSEAFLKLEPILKSRPAWIVLDEFQWMGNYRSEIVAELKMIWDQYLSQMANVSMILCGSIASFMTTNVVKSKAMYGRSDAVVHLKEFKLKESRKMLKSYGFQELIDAQMILGGIPKYLELLSGYPSLYLALNDLAFTETGYFVEEFDRIFVSHFAKNDDYLKIIDALAKHPYGLFRKELVKMAKIDSGGGLSNHIMNLESAGFIRSVHPIDKSINSRIIKYYISDAYLRFYYSFIKPNLEQIKNGRKLDFNSLTQKSYFLSWRGKAFENVCVQHADKIAEILGFSGINYRVGPYFRAPQRDKPGVQIDLIFDRDDNVLTLCEMKSSKPPISIKVEEEINCKVEILQQQYPRYTIQPVLIYDGTISQELNNTPYIFKKINVKDLV
ncbi:MAG: ATP-binding protein [Pseudomonadota bacterium]|nr:ATP-binding protein [Pseudomonadota bacterium]